MASSRSARLVRGRLPVEPDAQGGAAAGATLRARS
jgi:hypothetical protein